MAGNADFTRLEEMALGDLLRWHGVFEDIAEKNMAEAEQSGKGRR
jgi:hypothetical protein